MMRRVATLQDDIKSTDLSSYTARQSYAMEVNRLQSVVEQQRELLKRLYDASQPTTEERMARKRTQ